MAAQAIGSLFVALGLDSAAFQAGVKKVQSVTGKLSDRFKSIGDAATAMGTRLSVVSAGMAAIGGAGVALVKGMADAGIEIDRMAKLSNTTIDEFQRWAAGAKTAGIQQDKLADILKDVNDRVGDFMETGGGPMADFFENIAPKVGVTADQFKNLSGPQALQLYVSSLQKAGLNQQQMTFYLEAMASDATALIPLLQDGGKAMTAYGDAAAASGSVMSSEAIKGSVAFQQKLDTLSQSLLGFRNRIGEAILPIVNRFMDTLITKGVPALQQVAEAVEGLIQWFGDLPVPVQEVATVLATALGVGGPILLAVGALSSAFALLLGTGPIGLFIGAAVLATTAWIKWGDDIKAGIGAAVDWLRQKFEEFVAYMQALPARFAEFGRNLVQGLIDGITERWEALKAKVTGMAEAVKGWFTDPTEINSPSRVFMRFGAWLMEGLSLGIDQGATGVQASMSGVADAVNGNGASMSASMDSFATTAQSAFQQVLSGTASVKDALSQLASQWLSTMGSNMLSSGLSGIGAALGIPGFANGVRSAPAGLAQINERGGEIMNLPGGTQVIPHDISKRMAGNASSGGGRWIVEVVPSELFETRVTEAADRSAARMGAQINASLPARVQQIQSNPRRR
jgi:phage-related protein